MWHHIKSCARVALPEQEVYLFLDAVQDIRSLAAAFQKGMLALNFSQPRNGHQSLLYLPFFSLRLGERYFDFLSFLGCPLRVDGFPRAISANNLTDGQYFAVQLHPPLLRLDARLTIIPARRICILILAVFSHGKVGIRSSLGVMRSLQRPLTLLPAAIANRLLAILSILSPAALGMG